MKPSRKDVAKLLEMRGMLQELEKSGLLNILYHLIKKIRNRLTIYLDKGGSHASIPENLKLLFALVVDDLFANERNDSKSQLSEITEVQPPNFKQKYGRSVAETPSGYSKITTSRLKNASPFSAKNSIGRSKKNYGREGDLTAVETKGYSEALTPSLIDSEIDPSIFTPSPPTPQNARSNSVGSQMAIASMGQHKHRMSRDLDAELQLLTSPDQDAKLPLESAKTARFPSNSKKLMDEQENYLKAIVEKIRQEVVARTKQLDKQDSIIMRSRQRSKDFESRRSSLYNPDDSLISDAKGPASFGKTKRDMHKSRPVSPGPSSYYPNLDVAKRKNFTGSFYREGKDTGATLTLRHTHNGCRQKTDLTPGPGQYTPKYKYMLRNGSTSSRT